jgi:hypothetical protein
LVVDPAEFCCITRRSSCLRDHHNFANDVTK